MKLQDALLTTCLLALLETIAAATTSQVDKDKWVQLRTALNAASWTTCSATLNPCNCAFVTCKTDPDTLLDYVDTM